ncbi:MAG: peptide chain release factor 1 [Actinomycetia bacterium]|nr:peptide chain release factor 1 [Actinomycetes bacterium]
MRGRLDHLAQEFRNCEAQMADPDVVADRERFVSVSRRYKELEPLVEARNELLEVEGDIEAASELIESAEGDERSTLEADLSGSRQRLAELEDRIKVLLLPKDPNDDRNVILEIRGAEGGEEANIWAADLLEMYRGFAQRLGWKLEVLSSSPSDLGGVAEATVRVSGDDAWSRLKFEAGPHRVQRVPVTESQGRVHTSSATVAVLPEAEEVDVDIDPNDLEVDVYRSSGPGGQSVNTTDSAVRITHKPTGLVVSMQDQKSQLQNKNKALRVLRSRLLQAEQEKAATEAGEAKRAQIGGGGRGEKIRTYNYKDNRVTDHRIGLTTHNLDRVLTGELDDVSNALLADERARLLAEGAD